MKQIVIKNVWLNKLTHNIKLKSHTKIMYLSENTVSIPFQVGEWLPEHTHTLDTFSGSTISQASLRENAKTHSHTGDIFNCQSVRFSRKCQNTLTAWTHFQRALSASPVQQKMPGHTHSLDTFSESTCQSVQFGRKSQDTLTTWTHFHRALSASSVWQEIPGHSHTGHIFREHCQPVQLDRKFQDTLTSWTHFQRALSASPVWHKMPEHTHSLETFSESTVRQSSLAENVRTHSQPWNIFREHHQQVQFGRKFQNTLTA